MQLKDNVIYLIRYGVVDYKVFKNDLLEWKNLTVSTMMHKPFKVLIQNCKFEHNQEKNLISAICISSLLLLSEKDGKIEIPEKEFFLSIIKIPHINNALIKLIPEYNFNQIVDDLIQDFREIYTPILKKMTTIEDWNDFIDYKDNKFIIENSKESRMFFLDNVNKEVIRNISVFKYTPNMIENKLFSTTLLEDRIIRRFATKFKNTQKILLQGAINSIIRSHKKSRVFLILMSKYFFFGFILFKFLIKASIVYLVYKKSGKLHIPFTGH